MRSENRRLTPPRGNVSTIKCPGGVARCGGPSHIDYEGAYFHGPPDLAAVESRSALSSSPPDTLRSSRRAPIRARSTPRKVPRSIAKQSLPVLRLSPRSPAVGQCVPAAGSSTPTG